MTSQDSIPTFSANRDAPLVFSPVQTSGEKASSSHEKHTHISLRDVYKSPTTSLFLLLQPILDGRKARTLQQWECLPYGKEKSHDESKIKIN